MVRQTLKWILSKSHRTTAAKVTVELSIYLGEPVSTKTVRQELHNPTFTVQLRLLNLHLLKAKLKAKKMMW
jgi:hypothetical protein